MERIFATIGFLWLFGLTLMILFLAPSGGLVDRLMSLSLGAATGIGAIVALYIAITGREI